MNEPKTLKEALAIVCLDSAQVIALERLGFVIVPKEATDEMNQLGMESIAGAMDEGFMLTPGEVFTKMLAARPKIGDEG